LTSLVGRDEEMHDIAARLGVGRLVTVCGPGGIGKTRVALAVGARVDTEVHWCDLGASTGVDDVVSELARTFEVMEPADGTLLDAVEELIRPLEPLVVLDCCEPVIAHVAHVAQRLLTAVPTLRILTTSREPLRVPGEQVVHLGPLDTADAVELFVDRAVAVGAADLDLDRDDVAAICEQLDRLPLALELAAARARMLSTSQIAREFADGLPSLGIGPRTAPARHRSLQESVAWSHDLLTEPQRTLLRHLAVYSSTFDVDAVRSVSDVDEPVETLSDLIDRSMVHVEQTAPIARYRLLDAIRSFAAENLRAAGEEAVVRGRHLAHRRRQAGRVTAELFGPAVAGVPAASTIEIDLAYADVRAALEWSRTADPVEGLRLATSMAWYWILRGRYSEGVQWLETLMASANPPPEVRADALVAIARLGSYLVDPELRGRTIAALGAAVDDAGSLQVAVTVAGMRLATDPESAQRDLAELAERAIAEGDQLAAGTALWNLGMALVWQDVPAARGSLERVRAIEGPAPRLPFADAGLAMVLVHEGRLAEAEQACRATAARFEQAGQVYWSWAMRNYEATAVMLRGDVATARSIAEKTKAAAHDVLGPIAMSANLFDAISAVADGDLERARTIAHAPELTLFAGVSNRPWMLMIEARIAELEGDEATARQLYDEVVSASTEVTSWGGSPAAAAAARFLLDHDEPAAAEGAARIALDRLVEQGIRVLVPIVLDVITAIEAANGDPNDAVRLWAAGERMRDEMGLAHHTSWDAVDTSAIADELRTRLGAEAFVAAADDGRRLSFDETIAWLRRGRGPRRRPATGWESLTPTEEKVVELVAQGLSNPEVASQLFMSRKTVATHVSHVFAKLGIRSRTELAARSARR
jgi:predicted ATPase/DNA-binding CsgD family transcriptional regulator